MEDLTSRVQIVFRQLLGMLELANVVIPEDLEDEIQEIVVLMEMGGVSENEDGRWADIEGDGKDQGETESR